MDFLIAGLGLTILLLAGDVLVRGAVNLSLRLGVPALIVSLTIVAFGTSAPELLIAISAIEDRVPGLALGNVVGSNTANILLVLGVPALFAGLHTSACETRKTYIMMMGATAVFVALCFFGPLRWIHGLILLTVFALVLWDQFKEAMSHRRAAAEEEEPEGADPSMGGWRIAIFLLLGMIGLPLGADLLVDSSVEIARTFGMSEEIIGLTLVAIGTSLPELATTVMAAIRRQADVALGNVIGSNLFNLLFIMGIASLVGKIPVDPMFLNFDIWVMVAASFMLLPFVFTKKLDMTRRVGVAFSCLYGLYIFALLT